ncbi:MAG: hypothetical protein IT285_09830, partial [Bdellovibrionales bacterium]|nr:hypothetical protein [Bdellovibrionales bacterium]
VLDEAHHLEERVTEAFSVSVSGEEMAEAARRLDKRRGRGRDAGGDAESIARRVETVFKGDAAALLRNDAETLRTRITAVEAVLTVAFGAAAGRGGGGWGRADTLAMNPPGSAVAEAARGAVTEALSELRAAAAGLSSRLGGWLKDIGEGRGGGEEDDHGLDLLKTHADAFSGFQSKLAVFLENTTTEHVRLLHRNPRDASWRLEVTPVDVSGLAGPFFEEKRAVVLTSATLTPGNSNPFILRRLGLDTSAGDSGTGARPAGGAKLVQLPSPYQLERQAQVYLASDAPEPGTPQHLEALVRLTAEVARTLGGRTLLLMTSNVRLREASARLHQLLQADGIQVFDSATENRAAEAFLASERAVLLGGERYGEGLDIPGKRLTCVILEKIHEGMTRGHLAEARKAREKSPIYDYDFPLRMIWLKQRVGRLIRSPQDEGAIVIFDPRVSRWSPGSRRVVLSALAPMPTRLATTAEALAEIRGRYA